MDNSANKSATLEQEQEWDSVENDYLKRLVNRIRTFDRPDDIRELIQVALDSREVIAQLRKQLERLTAERDAAFKMSKCECGPEECCANLVKAWAERDVARNAALEEAARLCDSWGDAVDRHKWPTPFRMAEIIREMKGGSDE